MHLTLRDRKIIRQSTCDLEGVPFGVTGPNVLEWFLPRKFFEYYIDDLGEDKAVPTTSDSLATTHPHHFPERIMQGLPNCTQAVDHHHFLGKLAVLLLPQIPSIFRLSGQKNEDILCCICFLVDPYDRCVQPQTAEQFISTAA